MPCSTLRLLGPFALQTPGGPVRLGRKARAMLACAALQGNKGVTRSRLVSLLWPDLGDDEARSALRQCLHHLRRAMSTWAEQLDNEGDSLVLREGAWEVDASKFMELAARGDMASMLEAANTYRGEFLEALDAGADFERWARGERERLRGIANTLVTRLGDAAIDPHAREITVGLARRLLLADPVHEGCYRALMQLYARAGLRAKALQVWDECRDVLRKELDVAPSGQTASLAAQLRATVDTAPAPVTSIPISRSSDDPIVMDLLLRGWQYFLLLKPEDNAKARAAYEAAIEYAPDHAEAIAQLAWTHWLDAISGWTENADLSYEYAANCAARAVACDWNVPAAHTIQGKVFLWRMRFDDALDEMRRALALSPVDAYAHFNLGDALSWCGMHEESLASIQRAMELDPNDHGAFLTIRGFALWMKREHRQARVALESAKVRNPTYVWPYNVLAALHAECGELDAARHAAAMARRLNRRTSLDFAERVLPFRMSEHRLRLVEGWAVAGMPRHESAGGLPMERPHRVAVQPPLKPA